MENIVNIKTKVFNITPKELRQLIAIDYYKRRRILLIIFSALALITIVQSIVQNEVNFWTIYFLLFLIYFVSVPFLFNLKNTAPNVNFINRYWEIDEQFIIISYEDGSISKMRYEHFAQATKKSGYYFLYITKFQFHYLPIAAFNSEKDIDRFDLLLAGKQLVKLW